MKKLSHPLSRREFLRQAGLVAAGLAGARLLSACGLKSQPPFPTSTSTNMATLQPTPTPTPTSIPTSTSAASPTATLTPEEIIRYYPSTRSRVVQTHHSQAWDPDKTLSYDHLRLMLDASITQLTGLEYARDAWAALFRPGERIAIKVNVYGSSVIWTHVPLVEQVTNCLQEAGVAPGLITIYDMRTSELSAAGFQVNTDSAGVLCTGVDNQVSSEAVDVLGKSARLCRILENCDALINIPILKSHSMAGISFAMKNHFGSVQQPSALHSSGMEEIAALNALPEIKNRTRLIIGDALTANLRTVNSFPYWREDVVGDSIFMSFDPVAHDTMGLALLARELEKTGASSASTVGRAKAALQRAVELGLGTNDQTNIDFIEQTIG
jgi:uncharacterized protein (DUF362 family)